MLSFQPTFICSMIFVSLGIWIFLLSFCLMSYILTSNFFFVPMLQYMQWQCWYFLLGHEILSNSVGFTIVMWCRVLYVLALFRHGSWALSAHQIWVQVQKDHGSLEIKLGIFFCWLCWLSWWWTDEVINTLLDKSLCQELNLLHRMPSFCQLLLMQPVWKHSALHKGC